MLMPHLRMCISILFSFLKKGTHMMIELSHWFNKEGFDANLLLGP